MAGRSLLFARLMILLTFTLLSNALEIKDILRKYYGDATRVQKEIGKKQDQ